MLHVLRHRAAMLLAVALLSGCATSLQRAHLNPPSLVKPNGYSHTVAVTGGTTVYASGQIPLDGKGAVVGAGDAKAQVRQVIANLRKALAGSGAELADVVKITVYLTSMDDLPAFREVRDEFFVGAPPASSLVQVSRLVCADCRIEMDAIAVVERRAGR